MPVSNANALAGDREAAKRQAVIAVSIVTLIFVLWPEQYIIWRNLCLVPVSAWLTSLVFDLKHGALDAWNGVPAWFKRIIGADGDSTDRSGRSRREARQPRNRASTVQDFLVLHLAQTILWIMIIKSEAVRLWKITVPVIVGWMRRAFHWLTSQVSTSQSSSSAWAEQLVPRYTQYYGIILQTCPGPFTPRDPPYKFISPESKNVSAVPSVLSSWNADSCLGFCLIEKAIWDDQSLTLRSKLQYGTYWSVTTFGRRYARPGLSRYDLESIIAMEMIGLVDGWYYDAVEKCFERSEPLYQDWTYTRMYWEDVDFVVILALLVLGPAASTRCVQLYRALCKLRVERAEASRRDTPILDPMLIAAATGVLAAPFLLPLVAAGGLAAAVGMKKCNCGMMQQRRKAYQSVMMRFPEVGVLFLDDETQRREEEEEEEVEEVEISEESTGEDDDDDEDEWEDEGGEYYNEALSPFD